MSNPRFVKTLSLIEKVDIRLHIHLKHRVKVQISKLFSQTHIEILIVDQIDVLFHQN